MNLVDDRYCFACGADNPIGLRLHFAVTPDRAVAAFDPRREFQGWQGVLHGGIVTTLLDEAMAHLVMGNGIAGLTAKIEVRFRAPVPTDQRLTVEARFGSSKGKIVSTVADLKDASGSIVAEGTGTFVRRGAHG